MLKPILRLHILLPLFLNIPPPLLDLPLMLCNLLRNFLSNFSVELFLFVQALVGKAGD